MLIGLKLDLADMRSVSSDKAQAYAAKEKMPYFEVSAKTGQNVDRMFIEVVHRIITMEKQQAANEMALPVSQRTNSFMLAARGGQVDLP